MPVIYRKTAQGQNEIETRAGRIAPRLRSALILVDGKRGEEELRKLVMQPDETLQALLQAGMIEAFASESRSSSREAATQTAAPVLAEAAAAAPAVDARASAPASGRGDLASWRREAVRAVNDLLGPAGEGVAMRIEKATDEAQLRAAVERALPLIGTVRGGAAAAQFAKKHLPD